MRFVSIGYLSWKALRHRPFRSILLVGTIALTLYFPRALQEFISRSEEVLSARARSTPLLVGPQGSSIDLTLNTLYFTPQELPSLDYSSYQSLSQRKLGTAVPIHSRFRSGESPIIGTSLEYFKLRGLSVDAGRSITRLGDCVVGARLAQNQKLKPGDTITSSPENIFDLAGVYPLRMRITGILAPTRTPDDDAIFVDLKTTWIIEGLAHGHEKLSQSETMSSLRDSSGSLLRANAAVVEFNEVTETNIGDFHFHGDLGKYPISSVILVPDDPKQRALALAFYEDPKILEQIVVPSLAVDHLAGTLFATQRLAYVAFTLLGIAALALAMMVFLLSFRLREREMRTYARIGATKFAILCLQGAEVAVIAVAAAILAQTGIILTRSVAPELLSRLIS